MRVQQETERLLDEKVRSNLLPIGDVFTAQRGD